LIVVKRHFSFEKYHFYIRSQSVGFSKIKWLGAT
jgi:hypothetical protein